MNLILNLYVKSKTALINCKNFIKLIKFIHYIHTNHIFRDGSPKLILLVIKKFIELESSNYTSKLCFGRSVEASTNLLSSLIDSYFQTKSDVTLDQIMTVLKEEFIQRDQNNGRKQF